jgi:hypothetical protein
MRNPEDLRAEKLNMRPVLHVETTPVASFFTSLYSPPASLHHSGTSSANAGSGGSALALDVSPKNRAINSIFFTVSVSYFER